MSEDLARLVEDRSRAAVKRILDLKERIADPHLEKRDQERLRSIVVNEIGELTRLAVTLLNSVGSQLVDGYAMNQMWLEQIAQSLGVELPDSEGPAREPPPYSPDLEAIDDLSRA